jgi:hypothetical protein
MDIHSHEQLLQILQQFGDKEAEITFTQWEGDDEDEEVTTFHGRLVEVSLQNNEFGEKDLLLHFQADEEQVVEILMEVPKEEADLGSYSEDRLRIFGTEAEIVISK